ncbi:Uncharacterized protein OBRU01_19584 [Operophtera brumata]|uniref:Uncharacterized protein n=1 Tax=Operophtera brumata TaxID=104452 RepID=A0A0L7KWD7_OPEBR|nr:Uncharacterized protein OBRU01_19584 [Operophtera brumata]
MRHDSDTSALAERVVAYKSDPEKLRQATEFVDELIQQAKKQAELKQKEKDRRLIGSDRAVSVAKERSDAVDCDGFFNSDAIMT